MQFQMLRNIVTTPLPAEIKADAMPAEQANVAPKTPPALAKHCERGGLDTSTGCPHFFLLTNN